MTIYPVPYPQRILFSDFLGDTVCDICISYTAWADSVPANVIFTPVGRYLPDSTGIAPSYRFQLRSSALDNDYLKIPQCC